MSIQPWDSIRARWAAMMPTIAAGRRCDPYFYDWQFTPIEREAWDCIRRLGLPLYPQVPVGRVFIDFGDPHRKIGVELDGKDFHDVERDTERDATLWDQGWRIFRIAGSDAMRWNCPPDEPQFAGYAPRESEHYQAELWEFAINTGDGVLWALGAAYYFAERFTREERETAFDSLASHRLIQFPLPDL